MAPSIWLGARPARTLVRVAVLVAASGLVFGVALRPIRATGPSMAPTYRDGALLFCDTLSYRVRAPRDGDVVAIRLAGPSVVIVKRIVAGPGDRVRIVEGVVEVNGRPLDEPYVAQRQRWNYDDVTVGADEYFVMGDNRSMAMGAHDFGRVDRGRILGRIVW